MRRPTDDSEGACVTVWDGKLKKTTERGVSQLVLFTVYISVIKSRRIR